VIGTCSGIYDLLGDLFVFSLSLAISDEVVVTASVLDNQPLPGFLTFHPESLQFYGTAPLQPTEYIIQITASTDNGDASELFLLIVAPNEGTYKAVLLIVVR